MELTCVKRVYYQCNERRMKMRLDKQTKQFLISDYRAGFSSKEIADRANNAGLETAHGKPFKTGTVSYWLRKYGFHQRRRSKALDTVTLNTNDGLADSILEIMTTKLSDNLKRKLINVLVS